ncbi:GNAT family N-acetyltransferase [Candidatus Nitrospira salsa]|nr:MAG: DNA-binding protein [Nitrospirales bacterium]
MSDYVQMNSHTHKTFQQLITTNEGNALRIVPVEDSRTVEQFIRVPWAIYTHDENWVPPLLLERKQHLSKRNPYLSHATVQLWIAYRNDQPVGRISAQIDRFHQERYRDHTGFWGMLEAHDDQEVFHALLNTAEQWLQEKGMRRTLGPFNLSINQECGLLIDGMNSPPMVMMGHALPYYPQHIESYDYRKAKDLFAYRVDLDFIIPPIIQKAIRKAESSITFRQLRRNDFKNELETIHRIFEEAWSDNWGFIPFSDEEFAAVGQELRLLVDDSFIQIAEVDGTPEAMLVAFPNVNELIRDLNGRLFPIGWMKFLWRLKVSHPQTARVVLMGVRKKYQGTPLGAVLAFGMIDSVRQAGRKWGIKHVELSWILEDNIGMKSMLQAIGCEQYKTYRVYEKHLTKRQ